LKMTSGISEPLKRYPWVRHQPTSCSLHLGCPQTKPLSKSGDRAPLQRVRERLLCEPEACLLTWSEGQKASILSIPQYVRDAGVLLVAGGERDHQLHVDPANWQKFRTEIPGSAEV
jgi:hypothetical protein